MDWKQALIDSSVWVGEAYVLTVLAGVIVGWCLARFTHWGHQFWLVTGAFFMRRREWRPPATVALILLLTLIGVRVDVLFSNWYNTM